jgi:hypothetical protein
MTSMAFTSARQLLLQQIVVLGERLLQSWDGNHCVHMHERAWAISCRVRSTQLLAVRYVDVVTAVISDIPASRVLLAD